VLIVECRFVGEDTKRWEENLGLKIKFIYIKDVYLLGETNAVVKKW